MQTETAKERKQVYQIAYRERNREKAAAATRKWYAANRERAREAGRKRYLLLGEKQRAANKAARLANPELIRARDRAVYAKTPKPLKRARGRRLRKLPPPTRPEPTHCELCGALPSTRGLHLDHCHKTNTFRAWLCHHCNVGLGHFKDDPELLRKAALLLESMIRVT